VGEPVDLSFPVADVRLVRSHLGRGGASYEDLHVRRLIGDSARDP
jgi:2'-5' RNA ligase